MSPAENPRILRPILQKLAERLRDPLQLRAVLTVTVLASWYFAFNQPLNQAIDDTGRRVARERKRVGLAQEIEALREQVGKFNDRLPVKTDTNEWVQYMLSAVRSRPLKLVLLDTDDPKELGPYRAIVMRVELEGSYHDLNAFLRWVESNPRLLRIDSLQIDPPRTARGALGAKLVILGVMG